MTWKYKSFYIPKIDFTCQKSVEGISFRYQNSRYFHLVFLVGAIHGKRLRQIYLPSPLRTAHTVRMISLPNIYRTISSLSDLDWEK